MSSTARCEPGFPAAAALLDNSALVRLYKCEALDLLGATVPLHVAGHVRKEFDRQGPAARTALDGLNLTEHATRPGTPSWDHFCRIRGATSSTRDLGEDESLAVALAFADRGVHFPFVTYDRLATKRADSEGVATLDFLDTLAWLVTCEVIMAEQADALEQQAGAVDGWCRPRGYAGSIAQVRVARVQATLARMTST